MLTGLGCPSGAYDGRLVALGVIVCVGSSLVAFDLLARAIAGLKTAPAAAMLVLATLAAAACIGATPLIGMVALEPGPGPAVSARVAALSALLLTIVVGLAFAGVRRSGRLLTAVPAGALVGLAIVAGDQVGLPSLSSRLAVLAPATALSVALAVSCAISAVLVFGRGETSDERLGAALMLSLGILSAHFTGMAAIASPAGVAPVLPPDALAPGTLLWVGTATGALVAGCGLAILVLDRRARRVRDDHAHSLARRDGLTGLPNGLSFAESVEWALDRGRSCSAAVLRLDLDGFEAFNGAFGRAAGDAVLVELARRLTSLEAPSVVAARLDQDGFAVLLTGLAPDAAVAVGRRLAETLNAPFSVCGSRIELRCSMGMSLYPDHGTAYPVLLGQAGMALAAAKADGGGVFRRFDADLGARARADASLARDLAAALEDGPFQLAYRPRAEIGSGRLCGFEASLRWLHPERGMLEEAEVLRLAQTCGLAPTIGTWTLRQACRDASSWDASLSVAAVLHPAQAFQSDAADIVRRILAETGLDPRRLEIGVSAADGPLRDEERVLRTLRAIKGLGVRIALYRFGAQPGSSLSGLSFEFDAVKLDASRVKALADPPNAAAAAAIAALAAAFGKSVVAEGVDDQREVAVLASHGCTHIEGPLVGPPGAVDIAAAAFAGRPAFRHEEPGAAARQVRSGRPAARAPATLPMVELCI